MKLDDVLGESVVASLEYAERRGGGEFRLMVHGGSHLEMEKREMRSTAAQHAILLDVHARDPFAHGRTRARGMLEGL